MSGTATVAPNATLEQSAAVAGPTNVLIVGVGGQGVIMVSKILARLSQLQGLQVKQSEVHGMAKRGGSVFSHIRFGEEVWSPTIPMGEADVVLGLEWAEGLRWLRYLKPGSRNLYFGYKENRSTVFLSRPEPRCPPWLCAPHGCRNCRPGTQRLCTGRDRNGNGTGQ